MEENKVYYIVHKPSHFGMGSSTDEYLISEETLKQVIRMEIENNPIGKESRSNILKYGYDILDPNTTTEDMAVEYILEKGKETCSTYSGIIDFIKIPEKLSVHVKHEKMENVIFRVYNQWLFHCDILVGIAEFTKYYLDLRGKETFAGLEGGEIHEFTSFSFKNVLENHFEFNKLDWVIHSAIDRHERLTGKPYDKSNGLYISDLVPEIATDEWKENLIKDGLATLLKFSTPITCEDDYRKYLYRGRPNHSYSIETYDEDVKKDEEENVDFRKFAFSYPLIEHYPIEGLKVKNHKEDTQYYRFDEKFLKGADLEYLFASHTDNGKEENGFEGISVQAALMDAFGYD